MKPMSSRALLVIFLPLLLLGGCSVFSSLNREVETAPIAAMAAAADAKLSDAQALAASLSAKLTAAEQFIAAQEARLVEARAIAEQTKSDAALAVVAKLEQMRDAAQAAIPDLRAGLALVEKEIPSIQAAAKDVHAQLDALAKERPTSPLWYVIGTALLPFLVKGAQIATAGIPGVGPVVSGLVEQGITGLWNTVATARLKALDAQTVAKAKALDYQLDVTHGILNALPENVRKDQGVDDLLQIERARQIADGVHGTLQPLVAAREASPYPITLTPSKN